MSALERFIRYAEIDTQSDPYSGTTPSTAKQFDLARLLERELREMGIEDAWLSETGYVYGHLPANTDKTVPVVGFIAHMDTAPDFSGTGVRPRVIENYDGKDIELAPGIVTKVEDFPVLKEYAGETLVVTDGSTLLGADDKAGITAIMEALKYLLAHPEAEHGRIAVAFTPDEEIGEGTKYFDLERFGADFVFTMDGGAVHMYADETFNAAAAKVVFRGFSIHPGTAKDRMINAAGLAVEFAGKLPQWMRPEHTSGHEGFIHLTHMSGNTEKAVLEYILRDHDTAKLEHQKEIMQSCAEQIRQVYGTGTVELTITDSYQNMRNILKDHPEISELALSSIREIGLEPEYEIVRGGTDGAQLTYRGLPCPNLGTGGGNMHGRYEYLVVGQMEKAVRLICTIIRKTAERG